MLCERLRPGRPEDTVRRRLVELLDQLSVHQGIDLEDPDVRTSPLLISPDLVAPYSHQYNFLLEDIMPKPKKENDELMDLE